MSARGVGQGASAAAPRTVIVRQRGGLVCLEWPDGSGTELEARSLRLACRCSHCESCRRNGLAVSIAAELRILELRAVGIAGVQAVFSDGHQRGIYPWSYLRELADARRDERDREPAA